MERSPLVDGFSSHHRRQQQCLDTNRSNRSINWTMNGGQSRGLVDLLSNLNLNDEFSNFSPPPRLDDAFMVGGENNLIPRFNDGVYGLGLESEMYSNHNLLFQNGGYNNDHSIGSGYGGRTVHDNLESFQSNFYLAELQRIRMTEMWRRNNVVASDSMGLSVSPYLSRNEVDLNLTAVGSRRIRGNRVVIPNASNNVPGLSRGMSNNNEVDLKDLRGQVARLATDQLGCKMLQNNFGDIEEEIEMILEEVVDDVSILMMDQFGNYFVQKLIEVCSEEQRSRIVTSVTKSSYQLIGVCLNLHGTRAMQKLLESLTTEEQISSVISAISPGVVALIKDGNAYRVVQHCLKHFSDAHCRVLVNEIARNCYEIATDKSGCCVLQLCVDITKGELKDNLISDITTTALPLSEDRYGNYVVQHLLLMKVPDVTAKVVKELQGHFLSLACNKYSSNVVEKCLTETSEECSKTVIFELLNTPGTAKLLLDPYGNYVFQSALSVSEGMQGQLYNWLVSLVQRHLTSMSSNLYGKKVLAWFDNRRRQGLIYGNLRS